MQVRVLYVNGSVVATADGNNTETVKCESFSITDGALKFWTRDPESLIGLRKCFKAVSMTYVAMVEELPEEEETPEPAKDAKTGETEMCFGDIARSVI